jgi:hypothetical protein
VRATSDTVDRPGQNATKEAGMTRRAVSILLANLGVFLLLLGITAPTGCQPAQQGFNERKADRKTSPEDRPGIWMLDFYFKDPRVLKVKVPGVGERLVWYLWYQVSNNTGDPRVFLPRFVWVSHDTDKVCNDKVLPAAQEKIASVEDTDRVQNIKNSQSIAYEPIPVSREFDDKGQRIAFPKLVTGVAMWDDIDPKSTQFSIFVYGLSDGFTRVDGPDGKEIIRQKVLQLKFKRLGDEFKQEAGQIRYLGHDWIYATSDKPLPVIGEDAKKTGGADGGANGGAGKGESGQGKKNDGPPGRTR